MPKKETESAVPWEKKGYQVTQDGPKVQGGYQAPTSTGEQPKPPKDGSSGKK